MRPRIRYLLDASAVLDVTRDRNPHVISLLNAAVDQHEQVGLSSAAIIHTCTIADSSPTLVEQLTTSPSVTVFSIDASDALPLGHCLTDDTSIRLDVAHTALLARRLLAGVVTSDPGSYTDLLGPDWPLLQVGSELSGSADPDTPRRGPRAARGLPRR